MSFKKLKGTTDYYPEEQYVQDRIYSILRDKATNYGFEHAEPPVLENMELLTAKSGEEIKTQIFPIEQKSSEDMGLRFEFTAGIARMFVQKQKSLAKPVKWYSFNKAWRYERPQSGREREFFQFNCEIIGTERVEADAELMNMAIDCLCSLGLGRDDFFVKLNNRKLLQGLLMDLADSEKLSDVLRVIDRKAKISEEQFEKELKDCGVEDTQKLKNLLDMKWEELEGLDMNEYAREGYAELKKTMDYVHSEFIRFDITVARGLDYYTGTVFEIFDTNEEFRSLCGGGRYDNMIEVFGGESCPATGFGMGYSTIKLYLEKKGLLPEYKREYDYFVAAVSEDYRKEALRIAGMLRKENSVLTDLMGRSLSKQLKYANSFGCKKVVIVGEEEFKRNCVRIRDMTTGEEKEVGITELK